MPGTIEERVKDFEEGFNKGWGSFNWMEREHPDFVEGFKLARRYYQEGLVPPYPKKEIVEKAKEQDLLEDNKQRLGHMRYHLKKFKEKIEEGAPPAPPAPPATATKRKTSVKKVAAK